MGSYSIQEIELDKLLLDSSNPRHDVVENQTEALRAIILDQKDKLIKLAHDIVDFGINPSELTIVTPCQDEVGKYIVLEGNRRLAVIMLLGNPTMSALGNDLKAPEKLKLYSGKYKDDPIKNLSCVVFQVRRDADHWLELRHTGENEGRGVVAWQAKEKARFNDLIGKPSPELQVVEFVKKNANLSEEEKESLKKPNLTSIARLINDPAVRDILGIEINDDYITTNYPSEEIINGLTELVIDVATKRITVDDIRLKSNRADYISAFSRELLPGANAKTVDTWKIESQAKPVVPRISLAEKSQERTRKERSIQLSIARKTLIPSNCVLKVRNAPRINKIYRELRDLEINHFENSGAVMFRVFLEFSIGEYAERNGITFHKGEKLSSKITKVAAFIKNDRLMTDNELKPIRV
ncbi:MAG: hypothetical protein ACXAAH_15125, partial [Promethearchaeota archaeon]